MSSTEPDIARPAAELLKEIVSGYVGHPDKVKIEARLIGTTLVCRLDIHPHDYGKVVGSQGKNFAALQAIMVAAAARVGYRLNLILQDQPRTHPDLPPFRPDSEWDREGFEALLGRVLEATCPGYELAGGDVNQTTVYEVRTPAPMLDLGRAVHVIFHAVGKAGGRYVLINFTDGPSPCPSVS